MALNQEQALKEMNESKQRAVPVYSPAQAPTPESAIQSVEAMLKERGKRYGSFTGHAAIAQKLKDVMRNNSDYNKLSNDKREALEMIQHKIARILNGDPNYADSWVDIVGYAQLVVDALKF
jgi:hypothetical protein